MGDEADLLWVITGAMSATQNGVVRARLGQLDTGALGNRIEEVLRRFRERRVNMSWWVGPTTQPDDLGTHLEAHGLPKGGVPGMAADLRALDPLAAEPPALEIVPVESERQLWQWIGVHGHDYTPENRRAHVELYASLGLSRDLPWRHFLGLEAGEPAGASSLFIGGGAAGLYDVATAPHARRRGIGTAMSRTAARSTCRGAPTRRAAVLSSRQRRLPPPGLRAVLLAVAALLGPRMTARTRSSYSDAAAAWLSALRAMAGRGTDLADLTHRLAAAAPALRMNGHVRCR
jgi:GNAT superfamily N-acetyltransferase